ncbi:GNAT family N-acetyltransferase [Paucibacter sp. XJ19-41]|uniref:GNAT family N-acetyltransferase n=1 Tax=Paucibacter sp. XJ19-41 TaxID=2927824 RepID=UPI002349550D|nr:GNAT family N-acetyltransferase [Paucibacter sp. XJ19-41]MDC6167079.1 GNAT family N-acetyltransferase [Paucibacter sp. XJ19-41]
MHELTTERLLLRQWRDADRDPWAALCADPEVMQFLSSDRDRATSDLAIDRWSARIADQGWSFWAVELKHTGEFIGMAGLQVPAEPHPYLPCTEIGWRLARAHWGQGYASEAARRVLSFAFSELKLQEVLASTAVGNRRSSAVMRRVGMSGPEASFIHPGVPEGSHLRQHVLYRISSATSLKA